MDVTFVYRYDPKRPYLSNWSKIFNSLNYVVYMGVVIIFFLNLFKSTCECKYESIKGQKDGDVKNKSEAVGQPYLYIMIAFTCFSGFTSLIFNMLFPPNTSVTRSTTSEYAGTAYTNDGIPMDVHKVTTTTTHSVGPLQSLSTKLTKQNISNLALYLVVIVPLIIIIYIMYFNANAGCKDCCLFNLYDDRKCDIENSKFLVSSDAWK
ncbi:hypothetical protein DFA_06516 [Cavenderia fasciculata]|uniref:Uncharacterized protein n=1 Tax=Cavenderia fasciculata TaxID=261658 RepID=F4PJ80_CACFS|nr:uncharacterized protein DFA_06516 [Cavenderia fasciculata]EGG24366.1 hypothetical protein DFA_06516 [Cavenderia fasciculata]|eukprot:XP_004362217.1 hypothetical protein DFA_06516 [Cavenderia fasciculata]